MHPTLMDYKPGNDDHPELAKQIEDNIKTMLKAREVFASLESDRVLREALKQRIYSKQDQVQSGDWIYYRNNSSSVWKGPVKVTTREGKRIYVLNGGRLNTINLDDILLCKSDEEMFMQDEEQFVTAPKPPNVEVTDISTTEIQDNIANQNRELEFFTFSTAPPAPAPIEQPATENEEVVEIHD